MPKLVLTRREGEIVDVKVGDVQFSITVSDLDRNKIRLCFDAPADVIIDRREVTEAKRQCRA